MNKENFEASSEMMADLLGFIWETEIGKYIVIGGILYVILRLSKPIRDYNLYKFIFEYYAEKFNNIIGVMPLNMETPLATFFIPNDPEIYVNLKADLIHVDKILKSLTIKSNTIKDE